MDKAWLSNITVAGDQLAAAATSAACMVLLMGAGKHRAGLREWAVGLSLIAGLTVGYLAGQILA